MTQQALVGNAADREQVYKAGLSVRHQDRQRADDLRVVCSTVQGRRVLWSLLCDAGLFRAECHANVGDQYFAAGQRNMGCQLLNAINALDPSLYHTMALEAQKAT